jgi:alkaline phosphatase
VKTKNAYVAMSIDGKMLPTIAEKAKQKGLGVGLLTSDSINGATPSAFCAHVCNRANVKDIAKMREAQGFDVVEGSEKKNRLGEKTTEALQVLSKNTSGFFLMVEGGEIDHAQHTNNPAGALTDLAKKKLRIANTRPTVRSLSEAITQEYKVAVPADEIEKILKANEKEYAKRSKKDQVQQLFGKVTRLINTYIFGVSYTTGGHRDIDVSLWSVGPKAMSGKVDNTDVN